MATIDALKLEQRIMQQILFESPRPIAQGLSFAPDIINPETERELIAEIDRLDLPHFPFQRWVSKRRTRSYGYLYDFNNSNFSTTEDIPDFLLPLKDIAARFAGIASENIVQASVIKYEPGAGMGWHKDRPELDAVIGFSLGAEATMRFRRRTAEGFERAALPLSPRSIYHLDGEVRYEWEHSIPPMLMNRWSVTFRGLSEKGKLKAGQHEASFRAHVATLT